MAHMILTDCFIEIDGTEFSGDNTSVAISMSAAAVDITAMGADTKVNAGGVKEWSMALEFNGDEATTGQFFDMIGETVPVQVRGTSAARSATNPGYVGDAVITEYTPISGSHGEVNKVQLTLVSAGPLARLTTPEV